MHWISENRTGYLTHILEVCGIKDRWAQQKTQFSAGDQVCVRRSNRAPLSGRSGTIIEVDMNDSRSPYLIRFSNGLQFRYRPEELQQIH
jgi:hypothetical protein